MGDTIADLNSLRSMNVNALMTGMLSSTLSTSGLASLGSNALIGASLVNSAANSAAVPPSPMNAPMNNRVTGGGSTAAASPVSSSFILRPEHLIAQAVGGENFTVKLHTPSETAQSALSGVVAVHAAWEGDKKNLMRKYDASMQQLFDAIAMSVRGTVRHCMTPLRKFRNPLA